MKNKLIMIIFLQVITTSAMMAQQSRGNNGFGFGYRINQFQQDFGLGIDITTPTFFKDNSSIRIRTNLMYHEHVKNAETVWTPYANFSIGIFGTSIYVSETIRLYGEGGVQFIKPAPSISSANLSTGGYGLFGFEFFASPGFNYFIEIGGMGNDKLADKLPNKPIYSNGMSLSAGFRIYTKKKS